MFGLVKSWIGSLRTKAVSGLINLFDSYKPNACNSIEAYLRFATRKVWASWKACDLVGQSVQTTPFATFREGSKEPVKVPELERLLRFPNEFETFQDLVYKTVFHIKITGNAYWWKAQSISLSGDRPREIIGLNPKRMRLAINSRTGDPMGWFYRVKGQDMPLDLEEVIHFKRPHPDNDYYGIGEYEAGEKVITEFVNRQDWAEQFWKNGAAPSSVMVLDDQVSDQENWEKSKAKFFEQYGGKINSGKIAWLNGKWRIEKLGLTSKEMEHIESSKFSLEQILQLHGVPLSVGGIREAANFATSKIDRQRYLEFTVLPMVLIIQDTMNTDLIKGWGENLSIRFDLAGLIDVEDIMKSYGPLFDRGGMSLNELRVKCGLQRIEGNPLFDQHFTMSAYVPLDLAGISANGGASDQAATRAVARFTDKLLLNGNGHQHAHAGS